MAKVSPEMESFCKTGSKRVLLTILVPIMMIGATTDFTNESKRYMTRITYL